MNDKSQHDETTLIQVEKINLPPTGSEPTFLDNPVVDQLMETIVTLGGELWTERDHRYRLEALLEQKGIVDSEELKNVSLNESSQASRDAALAAYVNRIFEPLKRKPFDQDND